MDMLIGIVVFFLIGFLVMDLWYFLRLLYLWIQARLLRKKNPLDPFALFGMCTTTDADIMLTHKNNARYLREADFAMANFWLRTGIWTELRRCNSTLLIQGTTVRYRRPIALFSLYRIQTRILYWDDKSVYFEHRFVTLRDDFLRTIVVSKQKIIGAATLGKIFSKMYNNNVPQAEPASHLQKWIELNDAIRDSTLQGNSSSEAEKKKS